MEAQAHADAWLAADWVLAGSVVFRGRRTYVNGIGGWTSERDALDIFCDRLYRARGTRGLGASAISTLL